MRFAGYPYGVSMAPTRALFTKLALALVAILAVASCSSDTGDIAGDEVTPTTAVSTTAAPTTTAAEPEPTTTTEASTEEATEASPVEEPLAWLISAINAGDATTEADIEERLTAEFLAQVPPEQVIALFPQLASLAEPPYTLESVEVSPDGLSAQGVLLGVDDVRLTIQLAVEAEPPNLIAGAFIQPFALEFPEPVTVDATAERMNALGPDNALGVYQISNGECTALHEIGTVDAAPLGSIFKLWVLAGLAEEVDAGRAAWEETVPVVDELRSNPAGQIFPLETGTEVTLLELAEAMVAISDNTATDLLMDRVGRERVEAVLETAGVSEAEANVPLLSTGNLFSLKFIANEVNADDYRVANVEQRRQILAQLDAEVLPWVDAGQTLSEILATENADGVASSEPRDLDIEWFATPDDLCRTFVYLDELAQRPGLEQVADILEINPGLDIFDRTAWPTIRFKGGSEPGVLAGAWLFESAEGEQFVVAGGVANPETAFNELDAILVLGSAVELIGG